MFSLAKSFMLWFVIIFVMATCVAFAIDLPTDTIVVEAEAGQMDDTVDVIDDDDASEGKAIDSAVQAVTSHQIEIPKAGKWYIWIRTLCPDGGKDSYWIGIEGAEPSVHDAAGGEGAIKIYSDAGDSVNIDDQPFGIWFWDNATIHSDPLNFFDVKDPGTYTLWSKGREAGTLLDQILLTMDESFIAEEASAGEVIDPIPEAVDSRDKLAVTWGEIRNP